MKALIMAVTAATVLAACASAPNAPVTNSDQPIAGQRTVLANDGGPGNKKTKWCPPGSIPGSEPGQCPSGHQGQP